MRFLCYLLFNFLFLGTGIAQSFSSLAVLVTDNSSGGPISNAVVVIKEAGWVSKITGTDGKVFFENSMPIGEVHYIISKEGYQGLQGAINITTETKSNTLHIKLSKQRGDKVLISGEITDESNRELSGAIIEARIADIYQSTTSDNSGNYRLELDLNTEYDKSTLRLEAKCADRSSKVSTTVALTRNNVIYKDFKISCGETTPPMTTAEKNNFVFNLTECRQSGTQVICDLNVIHRDFDADIMLGNWNPMSRIIASNGYEYTISNGRIGNLPGLGNTKTLVGDLPNEMTIFFEGINKRIEKISLLEIQFWSESSNYAKVEFRDIKVD